VAGLALRFGVNANQLRRWIKLDTPGGRAHAPAILPVMLAQPGARAVCTVSLPRAPIEVEIGGALVRVHEGTDARHLRMVLDSLRA
jgi:transposase-like protein